MFIRKLLHFISVFFSKAAIETLRFFLPCLKLDAALQSPFYGYGF